MNKRIEKDEVNKGRIESKKKYPKMDIKQYSNGMRFDIVIILGMHRSGTSAFTKGLELFGVDLGENLLPPNVSNTKGYFEDTQLVGINEKILRKNGLLWSTLQVLDAADLLGPSFEKEQNEARKFLKGKLAQGIPIGLKDPRLCRTLPLWQKIFVEMSVRVGYLIVFRNPFEIASSLEERNGMSVDYGLTLWGSYQLDALRYTEGKSRLFVGFHQLLENSERELTRISQFLETTWNPHSQASLEYEKKFLDSGLRHYQSKKELTLESAGLQALALALDKVCQKSDKKELEDVRNAAKEALLGMMEVSNLIRKNNEMLLQSSNSVELFYSKDLGDFSEERKIIELSKEVSGSKKNINVSLSGEVGLAPYWRLDPGSLPSIIHLLEMKFLDSKGHVVWDLQEHREQVLVQGTIEQLSLPPVGVKLVSTGDDPSIILPALPAGALPISSILVDIEIITTQEKIAKLVVKKVEEEQASSAKQNESLQKILSQIRQEMEQDRKQQAAAKQELEASVCEVAEKMARGKEIAAGIHSSIENLVKQVEKNRLEMSAQIDLVKGGVEGRIIEMAQYASEVQDSVVAVSSHPNLRLFSWHTALNRIRKIKKPSWLQNNSFLSDLPPRPGFWRRLEQSIRKKRKNVQLMWSKLLFDHDWYLKENLDVANSGFTPWEHYERHGRSEGRYGNRWSHQISKLLFDHDWYLKENLDVANSGFTPWEHYVRHGRREGRYRNRWSHQISVCINDGFSPTMIFLVLIACRLLAKTPKLQLRFLEHSLLGETFFRKGLTTKNDYKSWCAIRSCLDAIPTEKMKAALASKSAWPTVSVLLPIFNPDPMFLKKAIASVLRQSYPYWELCIADDKSTDPEIKRLLNLYSSKENRIKIIFREKNGHISRASNSALELAKGEYVALLDHDDELAEDALLWVANELQNHPNACLVYSDEDKINRQGERHQPNFKPDFNWTHFWSQNLITHLAVLKTPVVKQLGGFRAGYEGSQDYDLFLRVVEQVGAENVRHIPRVLYHWREHNLSTAASGGAKPYALLASVKAVNESLVRQEISAKVELQESFGCHRFYGLFKEKKPRCSVIIPTRNAGDLVTTCVESLFKITDYPDYEVILVDNESDDQKSLQAFEALRKRFRERFQILPCPGSFNFSRINNHAVQFANGPLLCLLNNDTEIINADWMSEMAWFASRPEVGAVGAKLLYPSGEIQHAGVVLGIGGVAGHAFCHAPGNSPCYFNRAILPSEFSAVTAACLMVEKKKYLEVDGLDETNLKVAFNDTDFCLKLRARGYRNVLNPNAILRHHESKTRGFEDNPQKFKRFNDETNTMKNRWQENLRNDPCYNPNLTLVSQDFGLQSLEEIV